MFSKDSRVQNGLSKETLKDSLTTSMPRNRSTDKSEQGDIVYKDVCNPITKEFHDELYGKILSAFENINSQDRVNSQEIQTGAEMPQFTVMVTSF